jgi:hypothetical protein
MREKLTVTEQRTVSFYDSELDAIKADDGQIYVGIGRMCDALGLDSQAQRRRMDRHEILSDGIWVANLTTQNYVRENHVLRVDLLPLWLSGIRVKSVKPEIQPKLKTFQREAAKVLWEAFQDGLLTTSDDLLDEMMKSADSPITQAYLMGKAIMRMARQQWVLESRVDSHDHQLEVVSSRLETIEATLSNPDRFVSADEAMQVSQAVKAIALELGRRSNRNEYGGVYGELYRREGVTSYKLLPAKRFAPVMEWLSTWYQDLTDETDVPF